MKDLLLAWSRTYVARFNELSEKYQTPYYTQSPLTEIKESVDWMLVGINPKGAVGDGVTTLTAEGLLEGNPCWKDRFVDGQCKWGFVNNARFFLGYDRYLHKDSIDNDAKVVWTNLSPFASRKGFTDLPEELRTAGLESLFDLIKLLRPKRIVLMGGNAFEVLDKHFKSLNPKPYSHQKVFANQSMEVGRIFDIPALYVCHPSGGQWSVKGSRYFMPVLVFLHGMVDKVENGQPVHSLQAVGDTLRKEFEVWHEQLKSSE